MSKATMSYKDAGVDIDVADATKRKMADALQTTNQRVLNKIGAFASLFDGSFPELKNPVLVLKTEEPGSKQKLAFQHGRVRSICFDMINHLINDIVVMGARPLSVQDAVICGKLEQPVVNEIVQSVADACREQDCVLTGGETSEQPGVLAAGTYILTSSIVGVVDRDAIIDGSKIKPGDVVLAVASNGLHTNGYSLVRALLQKDPELHNRMVDNETFFDQIMKPHTCYYQALKGLFHSDGVVGLAHITGGGIHGNLNRVLPSGVAASIDLAKIELLPIFKTIREVGNVPEADLLRTFNCGVGLAVVVRKEAVERVKAHLNAFHRTYEIGVIVPGAQEVVYEGRLPR